MNEKTFQENYLPKIKKVLDFALNNSYSDFYRKKYQGLGISPEKIESYADFCSIPFLTKDEIMAASLWERIFVPQEEIVRLLFTSGTTGDPLVMANNTFETIWKPGQLQSLKELGVNKIMYLLSLTGPVSVKAFSSPVESMINVAGDVTKLAISARMAKEVGIEGIKTTPTLMYYFIDYLKKVGYENSRMKWISLGSDFCSKEKRRFFEQNFPNAKIVFSHGSTEIGIRGRRCKNLEEREAWQFHPLKRHFLEVEEDTVSVEHFPDAGEVIYTDLIDTRAFPLIRFKTGDAASLEEKSCACGEHLVFSVAGRIGSDFVRVRGMAIQTQNVEDSLAGVKNHLKPHFQLQILDDRSETKALQLRLKITFIDELAESNMFDLIKQEVTDNLYFSSGKNLRQLISEGAALPLEIEPVKQWPENITKSFNIIVSE